MGWQFDSRITAHRDDLGGKFLETCKACFTWIWAVYGSFSKGPNVDPE